MTIDCHEWELEQTVWRVSWINFFTRDEWIENYETFPAEHSVIVDCSTKEQAIDRAWEWCSKKDIKPRNGKKSMSAYEMKMLI